MISIGYFTRHWCHVMAREVLDFTLRELSEETLYSRRMWAAFRLGEFRQPAAIPGLIAVLDDPLRKVRGRAAAALIWIGKPVIPAVKQLVLWAGERAPIYAAAILGYTGGNDEIALLRSLAAIDGADERGAVARRSADLIVSFTRHRNGMPGFVSL